MKIDESLHSIFKCLSSKDHLCADQDGLMSGRAGVCLFYAYYYKLFPQDRLIKLIESQSKKAFANLDYKNLRFGDGLSGILWAYVHIERLLGVDIGAFELAKDLCNELKQLKEDLIEGNNLDLLHGTLGMQLLFEALNEEELTACILQSVIDQANVDEKGVFWWEAMGQAGIINMGLAHGQASLLMFLSSQLNHCSPGKKLEIEGLIKSSVDFILNTTFKNKSQISIFPSYLSKGRPNSPSRLAWCYGDLGIGIALLYTSIITNNHQLYEKSIETLCSTSSRKEKSQTGIVDLGFCHGSSGLICMYQYAYSISRNSSFQKAANYWSKFTLDQLFVNEINYFAFRGSEEGWQASMGLLDGLAGIGLSLISNYFPKHNAWREVFYLKSFRNGKNNYPPIGSVKASVLSK